MAVISAKASLLLFEVDLANMKQTLGKWNFFTTDEDRDRDLRKFYDLLGSAAIYLKSRPIMQKHVVSGLNDYVNAYQRWVSLGRADSTIARRLIEGINKIITIMKLPEQQIPIADPLPPKKDAAAEAALAKVTGDLDALKRQVAADKAQSAFEKEVGDGKRPWWHLPVFGAAVAYGVPAVMRRFGV